MCVSALAIGVSERWPLVIAGNRDEFFARPTQALHAWHTADGMEVWGGRDDLDGGGWMLVAQDGSAAALVTNVRDARLQRGELSRGQLTVGWIQAVATGQSQRFLQQLTAPKNASRYGGFNLICGQPLTGDWWHFSNRSESSLRKLSPGLYGVSNASLDTPWPKTLQLKQATAQALAQPSREALAEALWPTLADDTPAPQEMWPDTGVGPQAERALSSVFIHWSERAYGTRSSHVLTLDAQARLHMDERSYEVGALARRQQRFGAQSLSR